MSNLISGTNPLKLIVTLKGELKIALPSVAGIYIHQSNVAHYFSHWLQDPGTNAIWYYNGKVKSWTIGHKKDIGSDLAFIYTRSISEGPDDNSNIWRCTNESKEWTRAGTNDVGIQCTVG